MWGESKRGTSDFLKHAMPEPPVDSSRTSNFPIIPRGRGERTLFVQVPCHNEAATLPVTFAALPRYVEGYAQVRWLMIDDGSSDGTRVIALRCGADYALRLTLHRGLAHAFMAGLDAALQLGADTIVSTDGDHQYDAARIPDLLMPILGRRAAMVVGSRPVSDIANFFRIKAGSNVVSVASGVRVPDATSGFRAIHWTAAIVLRSHNRFSYVLEHLIQAGRNGIPVVSVPIRVKGDPRPSRLIRSTPDYLWRSATTIIRVFAINRPFTVLRRHEPGSHPAGDRPRASVSRALRAGPGAGHVQSSHPGRRADHRWNRRRRRGPADRRHRGNRRILEQIEQNARLRALADSTRPELPVSGALVGRRSPAEGPTAPGQFTQATTSSEWVGNGRT